MEENNGRRKGRGTMWEGMIRRQTAKQERQLEAWMAKRQQEHPLPGDVTMTPDVPCGAGQRMDVFRPKDAEGVLPVLVDLHGGGFLLGKKEVNRLFCADMAKRGFLVFCPEYPLAPEADLFAILRSLTASLDDIAGKLPEYGGDGERFFLCGDSAGAWLCVYLAALRNSPALREAAGVAGSRLPIRAIGLQSGMFYTTKRDKIGLFLPPSIYGKDWKSHPFRPYMDPEHPEILRALPPCFLTTSAGDFLRGYSRQFAAALKRAGADHAFQGFLTKSLPHAFAAMLPEREECRQVNDAMAAWFLRKGGAAENDNNG